MTTENGGQWERGVLERLATATLKEQRRSRMWGIFFKLLFFVYLSIIIALAMDWRETGTEGAGGIHTALVQINGLIGPGTDASAQRINAALRAAFKDGSTKGVVLEINSPGGSPVQAQNIYDEIRRLRKKYPRIPLYAVVEDICASGGYYVASAADRIYVTRSSIVGSVGVRMDGFGVTGLMSKLGVERRLLTAGKNKGFLDPFLPEDPKQKAYAQAMLDQIHEQFIHDVRQGRGTRLKETPDMFSGLIWTGQQSVTLGLADGYGTLSSVARDVIKAEKVVDYTQKENFAEKFARRFGASAASALADFAVRDEPVLH
jgi:protease-4